MKVTNPLYLIYIERRHINKAPLRQFLDRFMYYLSRIGKDTQIFSIANHEMVLLFLMQGGNGSKEEKISKDTQFFPNAEQDKVLHFLMQGRNGTKKEKINEDNQISSIARQKMVSLFLLQGCNWTAEEFKASLQEYTYKHRLLFKMFHRIKGFERAEEKQP